MPPGLLTDGIGHLISSDLGAAVRVETVVAALLAIVLVALHRRYNRTLFARSRWMWAYVLPALLAVALPFHYGLVLPLPLYIGWMAVSVFWQDYLTFGLLQSYLAERLGRWPVVVTTAIVFWLGHALFIPDRFAPANLLPSLAILALGLVQATLRDRLSTLHLILALHLAFYYAFA
ncbi:hypothetical protein F8O01_11390 [Pseudoclavibacter chungangensis]|uniref:CPBP family intramembrane metalloprotease n=1 Tax=Pseudoclavibacter chungangensis TaxID=587635 RepID=A0A7J5BQG7_9MICO|nr:hypothetical protein [Pseudoclavibacter chungangensis]KAB1656029.1 hypothetical protein F8O01_11390 [Pseudoclavibacter chungangensis]NYJ66488.1 hypothetical protein [Pseudoclavibacter chungangensis]